MAVDSKASNQRRSTRYSVDLPVEFKGKGGRVLAEVANIGSGGMCIRTTAVLPVRTQSFFHIVTKDGPVEFNVEAEVIWSQPQSKIRQRRNKRPGMMGLRFIKSRFMTDSTIAGILENVQ